MLFCYLSIVRLKKWLFVMVSSNNRILDRRERRYKCKIHKLIPCCPKFEPELSAWTYLFNFFKNTYFLTLSSEKLWKQWPTQEQWTALGHCCFYKSFPTQRNHVPLGKWLILSLRKDNGLSCQTITQGSSQMLLRLLKDSENNLNIFSLLKEGHIGASIRIMTAVTEHTSNMLIS